MELDERKQIENLAKLIEKQDSLKELTKQPGWKILMATLSEIRVDAMDSAVAEGDTTDQKALARALGMLMGIFYTWSDDTYRNDLESRMIKLREEIRIIEENRRNPYEGANVGLSSAI